MKIAWIGQKRVIWQEGPNLQMSTCHQASVTHFTVYPQHDGSSHHNKLLFLHVPKHPQPVISCRSSVCIPYWEQHKWQLISTNHQTLMSNIPSSIQINSAISLITHFTSYQKGVNCTEHTSWHQSLYKAYTWILTLQFNYDTHLW